MDLVFETVSETKAGAKWQSLFQALWPAYQKWFLSDGIEARQTYLAGYRAFKKYMPELLPTYEHLCGLAGGDDL